MEQMPHSDEHLMDLLRASFEATDPVPDTVVAAAKEAFTWRTIDAELADIVFDSAVEELAGVRTTETARQVTFRAPGVEIEVMVMPEGGRKLVGQLVPPQQVTVELHVGDTVRETGTDSLGRFDFDGVPTGPVQIAVEIPSGGRVITDWVVL